MHIEIGFILQSATLALLGIVGFFVRALILEFKDFKEKVFDSEKSIISLRERQAALESKIVDLRESIIDIKTNVQNRN